MLKNELKAALAIIGTAFVPLFAQADQSMSTSQSQQQQPGYVPGEMIRAGQLPGAYNQSAAYVCDDGWDVFITADYIWWDWVQDEKMFSGFDVSNFSSLSVSLHPDTVLPGYASGFQVGLGFNMKGMDDWNFYGEYTWYKNSGSRSSVISGSVTTPSLTIDAASSSHVHMSYNNADFLLQRNFYFGKKLTANFFTGLRALWITNDRNSSFSGSGNSILSSSFSITSANTDVDSSSWALGPKFGLDANWLLGYGIKFLSNVSASVLYTRYTESVNSTIVGSASVLATSIPLTSSPSAHESNYGTLRPILEMYLGLGWGSYFCDNNFHLDLSLGYDFNVYFNYVTSAVLGGLKDSSNMYLHGLNAQVRFDF